MPEQWRRIAGFDGYEVSDLGRVRSWKAPGFPGRISDNPRILRQHVSTRGYLTVGLRDRVRNRQLRRLVHRLVATAFIGPCPDGYECAHLNGIRSDNRLENLSWKSHLDNESDKESHGTRQRGELHGSAKLTAADVSLIRGAYKNPYYGLGVELSELFGVSRECICAIHRGRIWKELE